MASKSNDLLSNMVKKLLVYIPLDEGADDSQLETYTTLAQELIELVQAAEKPKPVPALKAFVFKKGAAAAPAVKEDTGCTKKGKPLSNYQRFVQVVALTWKGDKTRDGRMVLPQKDRPPGKSTSVGTLAKLVDATEISWGEETSFSELVAQVKEVVKERMSATGVLWLMLGDESREVVCE
jgi:hypothetical protein